LRPSASLAHASGHYVYLPRKTAARNFKTCASGWCAFGPVTVWILLVRIAAPPSSVIIRRCREKGKVTSAAVCGWIPWRSPCQRKSFSRNAIGVRVGLLGLWPNVPCGKSTSRGACSQTTDHIATTDSALQYCVPTARALEGGGYSAIVEQSLVGPAGGQALVERTVETISQVWGQ